jgi:GTPase SAR1 family protein
MAFVDLQRNKLVLKVVMTGPPAVGKSERIEQIGKVGRQERYGSTVLGPTQIGVLPLTSEREGREVEIEVYEWHGPEKADIRFKGMFVGIDGLIFVADARQDRRKDTVAQFEYLVETAGKSKIQRLPAILMLGQMDEGLLRLSAFDEKLQGPTWSERLELPLEESEPFIEALRVYGEVMLARVL